MMSGFQVFSWRGEPIYDIVEWARERNEQMVEYRLTTRTVYGPEVSYGRMPESFWKSLMFKANEHYERLN